MLYNMDELAEQVDVIFTATPQGLCASLINEEILSKTKIIDLSADFRLKDVKVYEEWYKIDQSFLCKRICCQDRTCCITSRIGHDTCILHFVPVDLAQSIDSFINIQRTSNSREYFEGMRKERT